MVKNWVEFFQDCIDDLHEGSVWALSEQALKYLDSDAAKQEFEGIVVSTRDAMFDNLRQALKGISRNSHALLDVYMQPDNHVNLEKSIYNCTTSLYLIFLQAILGYRMLFDSTVKALANRGTNMEGLDAMEEKLVGFYADRAMIDLDETLSYEDKTDRKIEVEKELNELRNTLFSWLTSRTIIEDDKDKIISIALSSNIDTVTKQLLVSALTLSCFEFFEYAKFSALIQIYNRSDDDRVKIKALVGVMLSLQYVPRLYDAQVKRKLKKVSQDDPSFMKMILNACKVELHARNIQEGKAALSKQLFASLLENTKYLLEKEREEDDSFDEDDEDENDNLSNSMIEDIFDMMQGGTDIYFSQFKNKKRIAFFHSMYNWFMPFSKDSVAYLQLVKKVGADYENILFAFLSKGHMCDNDQFSFISILGESKMDLTKAFDQMKEQFPAISAEDGEDGGMEGSQDPELETKNQIRQIICYLHNLSRFYELAPMRNSFANPFEEDEKGCFDMPLASDLLDDPSFMKYRLRMARYCHKKGKNFYVPELLGKDYPDNAECHFMLATAYLDLYTQNFEGSQKGLPHAEWLMEREPNNFQFCALAANVYYANSLYDKVEACWNRAIDSADEEDKEIEAKEMLANLYIYVEKYDKAAKLYFELNYKDPSNPRHIAFLVTSMLLGHLGDKPTVKRALGMLRSYEQNNREPDPFARLFSDKEALEGDSFAKSFSKFLGSMSEYMQQDHSMDSKLHYLEGICMWVLIDEQDDDAENTYSLEDVINLIFDDYHEHALSMCDHKTMDEYISSFDNDFGRWLRSFGISDIDMAIANEMMRKKFNRSQIETEKMIDDFKNGKLK